MKTTEPTPANPPSTPSEPKRRPYAPPAVEHEQTLEAVTLGTKPPKNAQFGC